MDRHKIPAVGVRIEPNLRDRLKQIAKQENKTFQQVLNEAIAFYLTDAKFIDLGK